MLLLLESDEPVAWLVARAEDDVLPVWSVTTSCEAGVVSVGSWSCETKRFKEVVDAAKALESFVIVAV